jgi:beta-glucanase (GH16 family)
VHTYEIDWTPDSLTWSIDGNAMRTKNRNDTYNSTTQQYHYPQSPSRVQLSLWPAGLSTNGQGTIDWAGGLVDWNSDYMQNGYYYAMINDVTIECYDPPSGFDNNFGTQAYYYTSTYGTNDTVAIGNNNTELASFFATGDDPKENPNASSSSASGSKPTSSASASATPETVPGVSGGGNAGNSGSDSPSGSGNAESSGNGQTGQGSGATSGSSNQGSGSGDTSFSQGGPSSGSGSSSSQAPPRSNVAGSAVALVGFFIACCLL